MRASQARSKKFKTTTNSTHSKNVSWKLWSHIPTNQHDLAETGVQHEMHFWKNFQMAPGCFFNDSNISVKLHRFWTFLDLLDCFYLITAKAKEKTPTRLGHRTRRWNGVGHVAIVGRAGQVGPKSLGDETLGMETIGSAFHLPSPKPSWRLSITRPETKPVPSQDIAVTVLSCITILILVRFYYKSTTWFQSVSKLFIVVSMLNTNM